MTTLSPRSNRSAVTIPSSARAAGPHFGTSVAICAVVALVACCSSIVAQETVPFPEPSETTAESSAPVEPPVLATAADANGGSLVPQRVTIQATDEDVRVVLESIAAQADHNIVVPQDVNFTIRLRLKDVTLHDALDAVLVVNGYSYTVRDNTILVYRAGTQAMGGTPAPQAPVDAKVFELRHIPYKSVKGAIEALLSPLGKAIVIESAPRQSLGSELAFLSSGPAGAGSNGEQSSDERSYRFMVIDEPHILDRMAGVLTAMDRPARLVYVSTVIFEMSVTEEEQIGLRWNIATSLTPSSLPWNFPFGGNDLGEYSVPVDPNDNFFPGTGTDIGLFPTAPSTEFLFGRLDFSGSQLLLELNQLDADFNLVSNPRLMVAEHQEAVLLVGERFPILSASITDQGTVTEAFERYEPIGVQLRVLPHILDNDEIDLLIEPQITTLGQTVVGTTGLTTPRINTRRVASKVRIKNKQSVVIAGLVSDRVVKNETGVPYLSKIPLLGRFFRHTSTSKEKVDLIMVVTPYLDESVSLESLQQELEAAGVKNGGSDAGDKK